MWLATFSRFACWTILSSAQSAACITHSRRRLMRSKKGTRAAGESYAAPPYFAAPCDYRRYRRKRLRNLLTARNALAARRRGDFRYVMAVTKRDQALIASDCQGCRSYASHGSPVRDFGSHLLAIPFSKGAARDCSMASLNNISQVLESVDDRCCVASQAYSRGADYYCRNCG